MTEIPIVRSSNIGEAIKHWRYCRKNSLPYLKIRHTRYYSTIDWDLWSIDVAYLHLTDRAVKQLDDYINSLFKEGACREAVLHASTTGFIKVKREKEDETLKLIWKIVGNRENWTVLQVDLAGMGGKRGS